MADQRVPEERKLSEIIEDCRQSSAYLTQIEVARRLLAARARIAELERQNATYVSQVVEQAAAHNRETERMGKVIEEMRSAVEYLAGDSCPLPSTAYKILLDRLFPPAREPKP